MVVSSKTIRLSTILLTTGGTVNITNGVYTTLPVPFSEENVNPNYLITGTETLVANFTISMVGTPKRNTFITFKWRADCDNNSYDVIILGRTLPEEILNKNFDIEFFYNGSAWSSKITLDIETSDVIDGDQLIDGTVTNDKIDTVAASKITGTITSSQIDTVAATKLTGTIDTARYATNTIPGAAIQLSSITNDRIGDGQITPSKLASSSVLDIFTGTSATTAVVTEEVLHTYSVPANEVNNSAQGLKITVGGTFDATATVKTVKIKLNGQTIYNSAIAVETITSPDNGNFHVQFDILRTGATTAFVNGTALISTATATALSVGVGTITSLDWTAIQNLEITGQNGTANAGDIEVNVVLIEKIK